MQRNGMLFRRIAPCVLPLFVSGCFLMTEFGVAPYDGVPGTEVRERISAATTVGFTIGRSVYEQENGFNRVPDGGDIVNAWEAGVIAWALVGIDDDEFYVLKTVKDCEEKVLLYSTYYAYQLSQEALGQTNPAPEEAINGGTAAFAAGQCDIAESGRWISITEQVNF